MICVQIPKLVDVNIKLTDLTKEEIENIFYFMKTKIEKYSRIKTYSNTLYKIETETGNYYMKIYETKEDQKVGYKLSNLYPLLLEKGLDIVPGIIKYDPSLSLINYPYLIITEIEGELLSNRINLMSEVEKGEFYYDLGVILGRIHSITFSEFGESMNCRDVDSFVEAGDKGPFKTWKEMHKEIINYRLSYFENTYFQDLIIPIQNYFEENLGG